MAEQRERRAGKQRPGKVPAGIGMDDDLVPGDPACPRLVRIRDQPGDPVGRAPAGDGEAVRPLLVAGDPSRGGSLSSVRAPSVRSSPKKNGERSAKPATTSRPVTGNRPRRRISPAMLVGIMVEAGGIRLDQVARRRRAASGSRARACPRAGEGAREIPSPHRPSRRSPPPGRGLRRARPPASGNRPRPARRRGHRRRRHRYARRCAARRRCRGGCAREWATCGSAVGRGGGQRLPHHQPDRDDDDQRDARRATIRCHRLKRASTLFEVNACRRVTWRTPPAPRWRPPRRVPGRSGQLRR